MSDLIRSSSFTPSASLTQMNRAPAWPSVPTKPAGWLGRHKQLVIALGCVGVFWGAILVLVATAVTIPLVALRSCDAYQLALRAAAHDPVVSAALGPPVHAGWFTMGRVAVNGPSGEANLTIPISGTRGSGTLNVSAQKSGGRWTFSELDVTIAGRPMPIDLLPKSP